MSLAISIAAPAWHKGVPTALGGRFVPLRGAKTGSMDATDNSEPQRSMSDLLAEVGRTRDVATFELLFRHFAPRVKAYMAKTGSPSPLAEELMQETMVAVWNKSALYDPSKGAASSWIFAIARNQRIDAYRRDRRPEFDLDDPALATDPDPMADVRMESEQSAKQLRSEMARLPPDQAEVLRLSFYEDQSQSEIAETLRVPLGTVKSRMRLAFSKLRLTLSGDET
ncbi:MAG: sigma-70 family RNA polymerase sigma factor [Devosia sp.]